MTTIYMDNCCYNRPFDERSNIKNYLEREAILLIMQMVYEGRISRAAYPNPAPPYGQEQGGVGSKCPYCIIGSDVLSWEMRMITNAQKRYNVETLYQAMISDTIEINDMVADRAREIMQQSHIRAFDSLHLASAETRAEVLLTTDIKFMRAANRMGLKLKVQNPVSFILEVNENEYYH